MGCGYKNEHQKDMCLRDRTTCVAINIIEGDLYDLLVIKKGELQFENE